MEPMEYLTPRDYPQIWKNILEQKAMDVAPRSGDTDAQIAGQYLKKCSEIHITQRKIDKVEEGLP